MKKRISLVVLLALLVNCAYTPRHYLDYQKARPIVISVQVGETIDHEEREKFDLFHGIEDFKSAMFYGIPDGGYEVEIITEHSKLIAVNRDTNAIPIMRDYIGRYEEIKDSTSAFEEKWEIVNYDDMGHPITQDEVNQAQQYYGCCISVSLLGILGFVSGGFVGFLLSPSMDIEYFHYTILGAFIGGLVTGGIGVLVGRTIDRNNALKAIREARKPRVVERF
ncbi:hypothetical protein KAX97_12875 [candidate division WOR-3 bacterium]|nr:hypothetical protein [candidate division WOR-3 bacterium]